MNSAINERTNLITQTRLGVFVFAIAITVTSEASEPPVQQDLNTQRLQGQYSSQKLTPGKILLLWPNRNIKTPENLVEPRGNGLRPGLSVPGIPGSSNGTDSYLAVDTDGDGVFDSTDNCTLVPNPAQIDTNNDGIGNMCDPDVNNDCIIAFVDISTFPPRFNSGVGDPLYDENYDFNSDGAINFNDYQIMALYFLLPPGPSANPCVPGLGNF